MKHLQDLAQQEYDKPLMDLLFKAHQVHRTHHDPAHIQKCTLLSIKTGGCPENCSYCPQSAHYKVDIQRHGLLPMGVVEEAVKTAKANGAERFCMGAAWRNVKDGAEFDQVLEMVRLVKAEGMEACVTLGMLTPSQASRLKEAGLDAYNHNLDTSRDYYSKITQTRTYDDRLETLQTVRDAGITVCCGGIIGMGESIADRCALLAQLASLDPHPESVPINLLMATEGTPLADAAPIDPLELVRTVAVARILLPKARVRLSAGRNTLSKEAQILAFFAGANSIHMGEKLLTHRNPAPDEDLAMIHGLQ